eukprot:5533113-Prorocentrum_lima.AAC.1
MNITIIKIFAVKEVKQEKGWDFVRELGATNRAPTPHLPPPSVTKVRALNQKSFSRTHCSRFTCPARQDAHARGGQDQHARR